MFSCQFRVLVALVLREIHTLYGNKKLGYLWALIKSAFSIFVFWSIRAVMHFQPPHGQHILVFLGTGFMIWFIFANTVSKALTSVQGNRSLLTFPQVFPLDIILARTIVIIATELTCISLIFLGALFFGVDIHVSNLSLLILSILLVSFLGIGCGCICSSLAIFFPVIESLIPMVLRILFFASGVFFSISTISHKVGSWLLYNPVMQIIEMARDSMSQSYSSPYYTLSYLFYIVLFLLSFGLLLERFLRRRLQA